MKRVANTITGLTAGLLMAGAAIADGHETNIIVVSHGQANDPFWSVAKNGVAQAAKDTGANVEYRAPETFDMVAMAQLIDAAVNQEPDGLVVTIPDAAALGSSIKRAVAAGIPVISMNSGSDVYESLGVTLHVGQDEYPAGVAAGKKLAAMGGKKAICVNHEVGNVALDLRCSGFAEGFGGNATVLPTSNDPSEIKAKVKAALESDASVDTVLTLGAGTAGEPAVAAIKEIGSSAKLGSFDLSPGFLQSVVDGDAAFGIDQQQYLQGYLPVLFLVQNARYGLMPGGNVPSGPNLITAEKAAATIAGAKAGVR
jgi:simple sugar transport system substrate-binding protein